MTPINLNKIHIFNINLKGLLVKGHGLCFLRLAEAPIIIINFGILCGRDPDN